MAERLIRSVMWEDAGRQRDRIVDTYSTDETVTHSINDILEYFENKVKEE